MREMADDGEEERERDGGRLGGGGRRRGWLLTMRRAAPLNLVVNEWRGNVAIEMNRCQNAASVASRRPHALF